MKRTSTKMVTKRAGKSARRQRRRVRRARAGGWADGLRMRAAGKGLVAHAGVALPRRLADRLGLTTALAGAVARRGFVPVRDRGRLLTDTVAALAAGAWCLSDVEAMTRQAELYGPDGGASDTTILRALDELAGRIGGNGLPGRRLADALAAVRAHAWGQIAARHHGLPAVRVAGRDLTRDGRPVVVVRLDATIVFSTTVKPGAEPNRKGLGFHPLTGSCSNTAETLAVMHRPGSAGSFTAADHVAVLDASLAQIPAGWRRDVLVTIDGAGACHAVIDHLTRLNTHRSHGRRGRRIEYSIGWHLDEDTRAAIARLGDQHWTPGITAAGEVEESAGQVAELTGLLREGPEGDRLASWPADMRIIARRVPRTPDEQAALGEDAHWRHQVFVTNTPTGQLQWLDARHRTQAHVEDRIKELKALGGRRLPSLDYAPLRGLAAAGRDRRHRAGLAAAARPGRRPRARRTQGAAVPAARRPRPLPHPRPDPGAARADQLALGRRPGHRLGPDQQPHPRLTHGPGPTHLDQEPPHPGRKPGAHPSRSGLPARPTSASARPPAVHPDPPSRDPVNPSHVNSRGSGLGAASCCRRGPGDRGPGRHGPRPAARRRRDRAPAQRRRHP